MSNSESSSDHAGWTPDVVEMLESWQEEAMGWAYMHNMARRECTVWHWVIFLSSVALIIIGGIGSLVMAVVDGHKWIGFIFGSASLIGGAIWSLDDQMLELKELATKHDTAAHKWITIPKKIQVELKKNVSHRIAADQFLTDMQKEFAEVQADDPAVSDRHIDHWIELKKKYKEANERKRSTVADIKSGHHHHGHHHHHAATAPVLSSPSNSSGRRVGHPHPPYSDAPTAPAKEADPESGSNIEHGAELRLDIERIRREHHQRAANHEHFSNPVATEQIHTPISGEVSLRDKFNIELNRQKIKQMRKGVAVPGSEKAYIESPYYHGLICDPVSYLEHRYGTLN